MGSSFYTSDGVSWDLKAIQGWLRPEHSGQLEQLERLRSKIPPRRPMIIHTIDLHQIPSQIKI